MGYIISSVLPIIYIVGRWVPDNESVLDLNSIPEDTGISLDIQNSTVFNMIGDNKLEA